MTLFDAGILLTAILAFFGFMWTLLNRPFIFLVGALLATVYFTGNLNDYIPHRFWW